MVSAPSTRLKVAAWLYSFDAAKDAGSPEAWVMWSDAKDHVRDMYAHYADVLLATIFDGDVA